MKLPHTSCQASSPCLIDSLLHLEHMSHTLPHLVAPATYGLHGGIQQGGALLHQLRSPTHVLDADLHPNRLKTRKSRPWCVLGVLDTIDRLHTRYRRVTSSLLGGIQPIGGGGSTLWGGCGGFFAWLGITTKESATLFALARTSCNYTQRRG